MGRGGVREILMMNDKNNKQNQDNIKPTNTSNSLSPPLPISLSPHLPISPSPPQTRIIIADDHPIFRRGLKQVIEDDVNLLVIGEAENGVEALKMIEKLLPDVAIIDGHMPEMGGLELAKTVQAKNLSVTLIFLTMYKDESMFNAAMEAGVKGYVLKDNAVADIVACIKSVKNGQPFIAPALTNCKTIFVP